MERYLFLYDGQYDKTYEFIEAKDAVEATVLFHSLHAYNGCRIYAIFDSSGNYVYNSGAIE